MWAVTLKAVGKYITILTDLKTVLYSSGLDWGVQKAFIKYLILLFVECKILV